MKKGDYDPKYGYVNDQDMEGRLPVKSDEEMSFDKLNILLANAIQRGDHYYEEIQRLKAQQKEQFSREDVINAYWAGLNGFIGSSHDTAEYNPVGGAENWLTEYLNSKK